MTEGKLFPKIVKFTIPVILAGMLQLLYNASDMIVVGKFAEPGSLGAVGATSSLINLIVNVFIGLSVGGCVVAARYYGQGDREGVGRTSATAYLIALISGFFLAAVGFFLARPMLSAMYTPDDVIDRSVLYMRIYFIGIPGNMMYNFGSAIMRGDTAEIKVKTSSPLGRRCRYSGFELAGEDGIYKPAECHIDRNVIYVKSAEVPAPQHVRYLWTNYAADIPIYNAAGLPLAPFRA